MNTNICQVKFGNILILVRLIALFVIKKTLKPQLLSFLQKGKKITKQNKTKKKQKGKRKKTLKTLKYFFPLLSLLNHAPVFDSIC